MRRITIPEFHAEMKAQGVSSPLHLAFRCPLCKTTQSGADLVAAGAGKDFAEVEKYMAFSCVGRWTNAGPPRRKPDGKPCNWTLGGFFKLHELEVVDDDGQTYPRFEPVTPDEAQAHERNQRAETDSNRDHDPERPPETGGA